MPWELQKAIYSRLTGFAALMALADSVYDHVPQEANFPYVVIGDDAYAPLDTHDTIGSDSTATVHTWSRYRGLKETKQIQREIYNALHRHSLSVTGADTTDCQFIFGDIFLDQDGLTRHGVQQFRVMLDEG